MRSGSRYRVKSVMRCSRSPAGCAPGFAHTTKTMQLRRAARRAANDTFESEVEITGPLSMSRYHLEWCDELQQASRSHSVGRRSRFLPVTWRGCRAPTLTPPATVTGFVLEAGRVRGMKFWKETAQARR